MKSGCTVFVRLNQILCYALNANVTYNQEILGDETNTIYLQRRWLEGIQKQ